MLAQSHPGGQPSFCDVDGPGLDLHRGRRVIRQVMPDAARLAYPLDNPRPPLD